LKYRKYSKEKTYLLWQWSNTETALKDLFLSFAQCGHFRSLSVFGFCRGIQLSIIPFKPKDLGIFPEWATCRTAGNKGRKTELFHGAAYVLCPGGGLTC